MVEEAVAAIDAMSREAMGEALKLVLGSASAMATLRGMESLGPLRAFLMPLPLPLDMLTAFQPAVSITISIINMIKISSSTGISIYT